VILSPADRNRRRSQRRRWIALTFLALLALDYGLSRLLHTRRMHDALTARLAATFGRPVEVGAFEVTLRGGPRLAANHVTVGEDPRFGQEYFLRAERLTAGLRWRSLLRGRFELGTISLTRPSLNVVRISTGAWNLESWLSAPAGKAPQDGKEPPMPGRPAARIYRVEVGGGRINFKRGVEKHPLALVDVTGSVEQEAQGRWRVDLEARLMRMAVALQEAGTIRVRGRVGGTAARLRPADLEINWGPASLADVLRLAWGRDYGIRGRVSVEMTAHSGISSAEEARERAGGPNGWLFRGVARLRAIHRWDLPPRASDPGLNLTAEAMWWPEQARIVLSRGLIEAPESNLQAAGFFTWASPERLPPQSKRFRLQLVSPGVGLGDLLAWYRAFQVGVKEGVVLEGNAGLSLVLTGWPFEIERGVLTVEGARLRGASLGAPVTLSRVLVRSERDILTLMPITLTLADHAPDSGAPESGALGSDPVGPAPGADALRMEGKATAAPKGKFDLSLSGRVERAENLLAAASALGCNLFPGWTVKGPAALRYRWQGSIFPLAVQSASSMDLRDLRVQSSFLSRPVVVSSAHVEIRSGERRVQIHSAQAFGARWSGTASAKEPAGPWEFGVATDHLDVKDLLPWLGAPDSGARERQGLLAGIVPSPPPAGGDLGLAMTHLRGRVSVGQLVFAPVFLRGVQAKMEIEGRPPESGPPWRVRLSEGQADFYGGKLSGAFLAEGGAEPSYRFEGRFGQVNVAALTSASPAFAGRFAGKASGELKLAARGLPGASLAKVEGRGAFEVRPAELRRLDLLRMVGGAASRSPAAVPAGTSEFSFGSAEFRVASGAVQIEKLLLISPVVSLEISGNVDFSRTLDLRVRVLPPGVAGKASAVRSNPEGLSFRLTGRLDAPQFVLLGEAAKPVSLPGRAR